MAPKTHCNVLDDFLWHLISDKAAAFNDVFGAILLMPDYILYINYYLPWKMRQIWFAGFFSQMKQDANQLRAGSCASVLELARSTNQRPGFQLTYVSKTLMLSKHLHMNHVTWSGPKVLKKQDFGVEFFLRKFCMLVLLPVCFFEIVNEFFGLFIPSLGITNHIV